MKEFRIIIMQCLTLLIFGSCSIIDEEGCRSGYILYQYKNNIGEDATDQIYKMTDFIFTKDSVLYRVDDNITNGHMRKRPISLPDGDWIIVTYGNLGGSSQIDYTIGRTHLTEMSLKVVSQPANRGGGTTYAGSIPKLGDSDQLYYGKENISIANGYADRLHVVDMSNVHIHISAMVRWKNREEAPTRSSNLHVRLEYVPMEHSLVADDKHDVAYNINYRTPRITNDLAAHVTGLYEGNNVNELTFNTYGLRWETGRVPVLRLYDGDTPLVGKDLPLEKYFADNRIDLTNTRVQFYELLIEIDRTTVIISDLTIGDWEDGGLIGGVSKK